MSKSPEYYTWKNLRYRCTKKDHKFYKWYGGRGITVCKEWNTSFNAFYKDMGRRPGKEFSIERIENEKGYSKENCKWEIKTKQQINRRIAFKKSTFPTGVSKDTRGENRYVVHFSTFGKIYHIGVFKTPELAGLIYIETFKEWYGKEPIRRS